MSRLALALAPALLVAGCGRLDQVDITRTATATVPGAPGSPPLPATLGGFGLMFDRAALQESGIGPSDVDSAKLIGLRIAVTGGTSLDAWLDSVSFFVEAPGLPRVLAAQRSGIRSLPAGTSVVELATSGVDLKPYLVAPSSSVSVEASGNQPAVATTIEVTATLRVDVNVTGLLH